MYTNPKPHVLPDDAQAPLLSRSNLVFSGALLAATLAGGVLGVLNARTYPPAGARLAAARPAASAASAMPPTVTQAAADTRLALRARGGH